MWGESESALRKPARTLVVCSRAVRRAILSEKTFFASWRLLLSGLQIFWYSSEICDDTLCNGCRQAEVRSPGGEGAAVLHPLPLPDRLPLPALRRAP